MLQQPVLISLPEINMRLSRIYVDQNLFTGAECVLMDERAHYLLHVLRYQQGDKVSLFNGSGDEYLSEITTLNKKTIRITVGERVERSLESSLSLTLVQGISRKQKMDYTIQKTTELGVSKIAPVKTEFCNIKLDEDRKTGRENHWQNIIISACEQSGRNCLPELLRIQTLEDWMEQDRNPVKLVFDRKGDTALQDISISHPGISVLIGPEGGLSPAELTDAKNHGYINTRLGPRVLRTESAAVIAVTACQLLWGDLGT